jgi:NAD-dependent SIR2 family protein deacetylase
MAIAKLVEMKRAAFVISQNIDGLHLRSGLAREKVASLHGDMFVESCNTCKRMFVRSSAATTGNPFFFIWLTNMKKSFRQLILAKWDGKGPF